MVNSKKNIYLFPGVGAKGGKENICSSEFSHVVPARPSVKSRLKARSSFERWRR